MGPPHSPLPLPPSSLSLCTGAAGGRAPVSSVLLSRAGPPWTEAGCGPRPMDRVHDFFLTKIILKSIIPSSFAKKRLVFSKINLQSMVSQLDPWFLKNNSKRVPSLRKIRKNSPKTSKFHIFSITTPNLVILTPKFSESLPLSFYAFI
jgi:hypothetical protein